MDEIGLPGTLVLIRHGESERNKAKRGEVFFPDAASRDAVRGTPDHLTKLTDHGERQAAQTGAALKTRYGTPDEIIDSGFTRTSMTRDGILSAYVGAAIRFWSDSRIRERTIGYCYDMTEDEVRANFPWLKEHWVSAGPFFGQPPGGESLAQVADRVSPFVDDLWLGKAGRTTFVVTHGNTVRCLRFVIEKLSYEAIGPLVWPPNCGIVAYKLGANGIYELVAENEQLCDPSP